MSRTSSYTGVHLSGASQYVTVVDDLGKQLDANGMSDVRFSEPELAITETSWMATMMGDSYLMSKLAHFGLHSYVGETPDASGVYSFIQQSAYPNTHFWMTEFSVWCQSCLNGTGGNDSWTNAQGIASFLLNLLAEGASAGLVYEAWDGEWNGYNASTGQDAAGTWDFWGLFAVDDINAVNKTYTPRKQFYTVSQITKYVRSRGHTHRRERCQHAIDGAGILQHKQCAVHADRREHQQQRNGLIVRADVAADHSQFGSLLHLDHNKSLLRGQCCLSNNAFAVLIPAD